MCLLTRKRSPVQGFCKEFVAWKALHHPNVLPLLGVIMSEDRFGMVSEWMTNGDINHFVTKHQDANRFELVCPPLEPPRSPPVFDDYMVPVVGRRRKRPDLHAWPGNGPRGSQGGASLEAAATPLSSMTFTY